MDDSLSAVIKYLLEEDCENCDTNRESGGGCLRLIFAMSALQMTCQLNAELALEVATAIIRQDQAPTDFSDPRAKVALAAMRSENVAQILVDLVMNPKCQGCPEMIGCKARATMAIMLQRAVAVNPSLGEKILAATEETDNLLHAAMAKTLADSQEPEPAVPSDLEMEDTLPKPGKASPKPKSAPIPEDISGLTDDVADYLKRLRGDKG